MRFLWKTQLKQDRGKFLPQSVDKKKKKRDVPSKSTEERWVWFGGVFLWLLFFGTVVYTVLFSSYLKYSDWQIVGLSQVEEQAVRETVRQKMEHRYLGFIPGDTFFMVRPRTLELLLREQYPLFQGVLVERTFPHMLTVTVKERDTIILWCSMATCAQVTENGDTLATSHVFEQPENQARTVTITDMSGQPIRFGEKIFESNFVEHTLFLREQLKERFSVETESALSFSSRFGNEIRMRSSDGWEIYWSTLLPGVASLEAFALLYDDEVSKERWKELEYIDLRTENRIFYRYKNRQEEEKPVEKAPVEKEKTKKKE